MNLQLFKLYCVRTAFFVKYLTVERAKFSITLIF